MAACSRHESSIRSRIYKVSTRDYLQMCLADLKGHSNFVEVATTNRVYVTKVSSAGVRSRYLVTNYRGEWRAAALGPER
jgi:hypothetical protein